MKGKKTKLPTGVVNGYSGQYRAFITINGKKKYLGTFRKVEQAAKAYKEARAKHPKKTGYKHENL